MSSDPGPPVDDASRERVRREAPGGAGLCASCIHLRLIESPRTLFVRCGLAATDPRFPRYPALPVFACAGYRESRPVS